MLEENLLLDDVPEAEVEDEVEEDEDEDVTDLDEEVEGRISR